MSHSEELDALAATARAFNYRKPTENRVDVILLAVVQVLASESGRPRPSAVLSLHLKNRFGLEVTPPVLAQLGKDTPRYLTVEEDGRIALAVHGRDLADDHGWLVVSDADDDERDPAPPEIDESAEGSPIQDDDEEPDPGPAVRMFADLVESTAGPALEEHADGGPDTLSDPKVEPEAGEPDSFRLSAESQAQEVHEDRAAARRARIAELGRSGDDDFDRVVLRGLIYLESERVKGPRKADVISLNRAAKRLGVEPMIVDEPPAEAASNPVAGEVEIEIEPRTEGVDEVTGASRWFPDGGSVKITTYADGGRLVDCADRPDPPDRLEALAAAAIQSREEAAVDPFEQIEGYNPAADNEAALRVAADEYNADRGHPGEFAFSATPTPDRADLAWSGSVPSRLANVEETQEGFADLIAVLIDRLGGKIVTASDGLTEIQWPRADRGPLAFDDRAMLEAQVVEAREQLAIAQETIRRGGAELRRMTEERDAAITTIRAMSR
jgi:hypothetical protein